MIIDRIGNAGDNDVAVAYGAELEYMATYGDVVKFPEDVLRFVHNDGCCGSFSLLFVGES